MVLEQFGATLCNVVMSDSSQDCQLVIGRQDVSIAEVLVKFLIGLVVCSVFTVFVIMPVVTFSYGRCSLLQFMLCLVVCSVFTVFVSMPVVTFSYGRCSLLQFMLCLFAIFSHCLHFYIHFFTVTNNFLPPEFCCITIDRWTDTCQPSALLFSNKIVSSIIIHGDGPFWLLTVGDTGQTPLL